MEVLLTGASGFLGKRIVKELTNQHNLHCLSRTFGNYKICLEKEIPRFKVRFNLIIHAAGKAHSIPKTIVEKQLFYDVNVLGTLHLLKGLEQSGIPEQFVFISSVSVYGQDSGNSIDENHNLDSTDAYGLSKIKAEKIVKDWCQQNNVICTILRLPLLVGEKPPGNLGQMVMAIEKGYYFNIGGGTARKSMVLTKDVAAFITTVSSIGGTYNLTDGEHPSFYELSAAISKQKNKKTIYNLPSLLAQLMGYVGDLIGKKAPVNSLKIKKITSDLTFDDAKAKKVLGWNPEHVLEYLEKNII
jgi:nucleoside-diphosphate-sugar epimerase